MRVSQAPQVRRVLLERPSSVARAARQVRQALKEGLAHLDQPAEPGQLASEQLDRPEVQALLEQRSLAVPPAQLGLLVHRELDRPGRLERQERQGTLE